MGSRTAMKGERGSGYIEGKKIQRPMSSLPLFMTCRRSFHAPVLPEDESEKNQPLHLYTVIISTRTVSIPRRRKMYCGVVKA
jgi:hypothetical protein